MRRTLPTSHDSSRLRLSAAACYASDCVALPGPHLSPVLSVIANILSVGVADEAHVDLAVATARLLDSEEVCDYQSSLERQACSAGLAVGGPVSCMGWTSRGSAPLPHVVTMLNVSCCPTASDGICAVQVALLSTEVEFRWKAVVSSDQS